MNNAVELEETNKKINLAVLLSIEYLYIKEGLICYKGMCLEAIKEGKLTNKAWLDETINKFKTTYELPNCQITLSDKERELVDVIIKYYETRDSNVILPILQ